MFDIFTVIYVGIQYIVHHTKATYIKLVYVDTDLDILNVIILTLEVEACKRNVY